MEISLKHFVIDSLEQSTRARSTEEILNRCRKFGIIVARRELKRALYEALRDGEVEQIVRFVSAFQVIPSRRSRVKETLWQIAGVDVARLSRVKEDE